MRESHYLCLLSPRQHGARESMKSMKNCESVNLWKPWKSLEIFGILEKQRGNLEERKMAFEGGQ